MYFSKLSRFVFDFLFWFSTLSLVSMRILFLKPLKNHHIALVATSDALKLAVAINSHYKKLTIFDVSQRPKPSYLGDMVSDFTYPKLFLKLLSFNFDVYFLLPHLSPHLLGSAFYFILRLYSNIPVAYYEDGLNAILNNAVSNSYLRPSRYCDHNYLLDYSWDYPGIIGLNNSATPINLKHFVNFKPPSSLDQSRSLHLIYSKYLSPARVEAVLSEEISRQSELCNGFRIFIYLHPNPSKNVDISSRLVEYATIFEPSSDITQLLFSNLTADNHIASGITSSLPLLLSSLHHCDLLEIVRSIRFPVDASFCSSVEQSNELFEFVGKFSSPLLIS